MSEDPEPAATAPDGGVTEVESADFGRLQGHEPGDDLATDNDHCIRCGFCTTACPVFEETGWESVSPRGHANVIAAYLDDDLEDQAAFAENLDLCIKCKQCIAPCPAGVEIPKLVMRAHEKHKAETGISIADRLFAHPWRMNRLASLTAPVSNLLMQAGPVRSLLETIAGIDARRPLPTAARTTFEDWFAQHSSLAPLDGGVDRDVMLFVDCYTNYNEPRIGKAAVRVLERLGVDVALADNGCCGRAALSKGLIDEAEAYADAHIEYLADLVSSGYDIVALEPSCGAMLKDEYTDFYSDSEVMAVAEQTYELMEYIESLLGEVDVEFESHDGSFAYHSHCHTKHLGIDAAPAEVLRQIPGVEVAEPQVSCCGMAGSFGYQADYYDLSMDIGESLFAQIREADGEPVATGFSCRHQIADGMDHDPRHPIEIVDDCLNVA